FDRGFSTILIANQTNRPRKSTANESAASADQRSASTVLQTPETGVNGLTDRIAVGLLYIQIDNVHRAILRTHIAAPERFLYFPGIELTQNLRIVTGFHPVALLEALVGRNESFVFRKQIRASQFLLLRSIRDDYESQRAYAAQEST